MVRSCFFNVIFFILISHVSLAAMRDPTAPRGWTGATMGNVPSGDEYQLNSVLIDKQRRVAVINGKVLKVGDVVNDARVIRIVDKNVQLMRDKQIFTLFLFPQAVKQPYFAGPEQLYDKAESGKE